MAVKSIIDVEVNDEQFKAFSALFGKYQEAMKTMPDAWKQTGEVVGETQKDIMSMASALLAQNELLHKQLLAHLEIGKEVGKTESTFDRMAHSTKKVWDNVTGITLSLLKWSTITTAVGALMGFGGLFGYEALARSAGGARTSAMGLGVTPGQLQAANLVYGNKLGDAGGILSRLADTQNDVGKSAKMGAILGIPRRDMDEKNAAELLPEMLEALQKRLQRIPDKQLGNMAHALGLTDYASLSDLRILKGMSPEELRAMGKLAPQTAQDVGGSSEVDRKYQDFLTKLETATQKSENSLIDALAPLAGPIGDIIKAFSKDLEILFKNPAVKQGMTDFATWLAEVPALLGSKETKDAFADFIHGVVGMAKTLQAFIKWFGFDKKIPEPPKNFDEQLKEENQKWLWNQSYHPDENGGPMRAMNASYRTENSTGGPMRQSFPRRNYSGQFSGLEKQYDLPAGLLNSTMMAESGGDDNSLSSAGAQGSFQFMPETAKRFGLTNPHDKMQSATAAAKYFSYLLQMFNGNVEQAVAGYNWGEGNVLADIRKHGRDWKRYLPNETSVYVPKVVGGLSHGTTQAPASGVNLHVYNQTGGSIVASAAAMGAIPA